MPTTILKIGGSSVDRIAHNLRLRRFTIGSTNGPEECEFAEILAIAPSYNHGDSVKLEVNTVLKFRGIIVGDEGPGNNATINYRALGGSYLADLVPITHPTRGIGTRVYNAPIDDVDYDPGLAGLEVGQILTSVLQEATTAAALWNAGIEAYTAAPPYSPTATLKSQTVTDFADLDTVPLQAVRLSGARMWSQLVNVVRQWMPTFRLRILPDGTIRATDTRTLTPRTLTVGTDPIRLPTLRRDSQDCATAITIRGLDEVEGTWLSLENGDLTEDWTGTEESNWSWADYVTPTDGYDHGTIASETSTTVTVEPAGSRTWAANYWSNIKATITVIDDASSGAVTYQETRIVVSNTAVTGGSSVITLDRALANSGHDRYEMVGLSGGSHVWRRYKIATQDIADAVVRRFPYPVATANLGNGLPGGQAGITQPFGWNVQYSDAANLIPGQVFLLQFDLITDPADDEIKVLANEPTCKPWTSQTDLDLGGAAVTGPDDIRVFVPVSLGALTVRKPSSGYEGNAYTVEGISREVTIDLDEWIYKADSATVEALAQDLLDSIKDVVVTGSIEYLGYDADGVDAAGIESLEIASDFDDYVVDGIALPIERVEVRYETTGPHQWITTYQVSNKRYPFHGNDYFVPRGYQTEDPLADTGAVDLRGGL